MQGKIIAALASLTLGAQADAALISRLSGQAYYDDVLNITWVADANLAKTQGYDADGQMFWPDAVVWIDSLNTANYLGVNDWRLPSADVNADANIIDCATASELNCRDNELGYMYWQNGVTASSPSPFTNLQGNLPNRTQTYWYGTDAASEPGGHWEIAFETGQVGYDDGGTISFSWAVRPGDIAPVPVPAGVWLLVSALGLLGWSRRLFTAPGVT